MKDSNTLISPNSSTTTNNKEKSPVPTTPTPTTPSSSSLTTTTTTTAAAATTASFPDTRAELAQLLKKKEEIEKSLSDIEEQIYAFETSYLKQTQDTGNCIRGWNSFLATNSGNTNSNDKSSKFRESDRLFSYSSATSYTLLGRDQLKREREKERRKTKRKNREIMEELSDNRKNSENNSQSTQLLNDDMDEDIEDEDESTTSSEKPSSRTMTNTSTASKRRAKIKRLRNKRTLSDSSQQSESRD